MERSSNKRVLFVGSSITKGSNYDGFLSWPNVLSNILNFECINNGVGGTGYLATGDNGSLYPYYDRIKELLGKLSNRNLSPDVIVIGAGPNDCWSSSYTDVQIMGEAKKCYEYIKGNSNAKVIMIGIYWSSSDVPEKFRLVNNQLREYALGNGIPFIDLLEGDTYGENGEKLTDSTPYITGTGHETDEKNDGNADQYVCYDGTHLSIEGSKYFGETLAEELSKILK